MTTPADRLLAHADGLPEHASDCRVGADALQRLPAALLTVDTQAATIANQQSTITAQAGTIASQVETIAYLQAQLAGQPVVPLMDAVPAGVVVERAGLNLHLNYGKTSPWAHTDDAVQWALGLGISTVRQRLATGTYVRGVIRDGMAQLQEAGIRWCCTVFAPEDATTLDQARKVVNDQLDWLAANTNLTLLDSLTGPNEPNNPSRDSANWVQRTRWAQQALKEETRKRTAFARVILQGSPLNMKGGPNAVAPDVAALGSLAPWIDRGDVHLYPGDADPEYQLTDRLNALSPLHPGLPICVTEGGYSTAIGRGYTGGAELVPEDIQALYIVKQYLTHAAAGRVFHWYELLDDITDDIREGGFGLVRTPSADPKTWTAKPAWHALRRLMDLCRDTDHTPQPLAATVTDGSPDLRTLLLHRSDGRWLLCLWRATDLYQWDRETLTGKALSIGGEACTVTFDRTRTVRRFEPSAQDGPTDTFTASKLSPTVGSGVLIVEIS